MRTILLPIEPLPERYSVDWYTWFNEHWSGEKVNILGDPITERIEEGSFLDVYGTGAYKASQMATCIEWARKIEFGKYASDWFLFHDGWNADVMHLAYLRSGANLKYKIAGCFHAGCWDSQDFLCKKEMHRWAEGLEKSMLEIYDAIFVATQFHRDLLVNYAGIKHGLSIEDKVHVTGFPIYPGRILKREILPEKITVVFPHRLDAEKQPSEFDQLAYDFREDRHYEFIKTKDVCKTKTEYFQLLFRSTAAVSFALQETWGIAMQEALFCGAIPFVPNRLSYVEMYDEDFQWKNYTDLVQKLKQLRDPETAAKLEMKREWSARALARAGWQAIPNMERIMEHYDS